jgi:hypothetical protein
MLADLSDADQSATLENLRRMVASLRRSRGTSDG